VLKVGVIRPYVPNSVHHCTEIRYKLKNWLSRWSDGTRPDFTDNRAWYDIKILSDGSLQNTKEMQRRSYTEKVKECFKALGIMSGAHGHWGRIRSATIDGVGGGIT
jgi:hypothetical protein